MEEHKSIDHIKLSTMMTGRLEQRCSVDYRGLLQLGVPWGTTCYQILKTPDLQCKMSALSSESVLFIQLLL